MSIEFHLTYNVMKTQDEIVQEVNSLNTLQEIKILAAYYKLIGLWQTKVIILFCLRTMEILESEGVDATELLDQFLDTPEPTVRPVTRFIGFKNFSS